MKVTISNNTLSVISTFSMAQLQRCKKYAPEALILYKGEGKDKEPICEFMLGAKGSADSIGVVFADETKVGEAKAIVTMIIPQSVASGAEGVKAWAREKLGLNFVANCNEIEAQITDALQDLTAAEVAMDAAIEIVGEPAVVEEVAE